MLMIPQAAVLTAMMSIGLMLEGHQLLMIIGQFVTHMSAKYPPPNRPTIETALIMVTMYCSPISLRPDEYHEKRSPVDTTLSSQF